MIWHPCPCWCTGCFFFDRWRLALGGGMKMGFEPPTGADEDEWANKTWRNCFCKEGGWMPCSDIVLRAAKGAGWFIVAAADSQRFTSPPYLFRETLRSLITAPSLFHSLIHVLIRGVIPHIIHPCEQRTTLYVRQSLRGENKCSKCHSHVDFAFHYHLMVKNIGKRYKNCRK